jgi:hypothetical protein
MPGTPTEKVAFARMLLDSEAMPDSIPIWADGTRATEAEIGELSTLAMYEMRTRAEKRRYAARRPHRQRALALLKSFLDDAQLAQLKERGHFDHVAPSGRHYRFWPRGGGVSEVRLHRTRWFPVQHFCIHPEDNRDIPPADTTLAQLLTLVESEERFLETAHASRTDLWNGEWLRTCARGRRRRREAALAIQARCAERGWEVDPDDPAIRRLIVSAGARDPATYDAWLAAMADGEPAGMTPDGPVYNVWMDAE